MNIPIDDFSSIIHAYYDGGESYKGHKKYSLIKKYRSNPKNCLVQSWDGFKVEIKSENMAVIECEDIEIPTFENNKFRIFASVPENVFVSLYCNEVLVLIASGDGCHFYDGDILFGEKYIKKIRYEIKNTNEKDLSVALFYLGMINDTKRQRQYFTENWEGFFAEDADYELYNENFISADELESIRNKIKVEPYKSAYEDARKKALAAMNEIPENQISRTNRKHHMSPRILSDSVVLAVIGQIDGNREMLRMACRYALSLASCEYWCADVMETIPTITWHHRSFDESYILYDISVVLSMAGGILSWHGRNYLYNMMIMKGFPRIEADFMTMEYIYNCNQGMIFMRGYLAGLLTVAREYPRYLKRIDDAKKIMEEFFAKSFEEDGSYQEGPVYWMFIILMYLECLYMLSRYEKKELNEYCTEGIMKTQKFGLSLLDKRLSLVTYSDSRLNKYYGYEVSALMYMLTKNEEWANLFNNMPKETATNINEILLSGAFNIPDSDKVFIEEYVYYPKSGIVRLDRDNILFFAMVGPSNDTHAHCDKGSFIIYKGDTQIVPDCSDEYEVPEAIDLYKSRYHSVTLPIKDGEYVNQYKGEGYAALVKNASYENRNFELCCDMTDIWDTEGIKTSTRTIISDKSNEFLITDEFEFEEETEIEFKLNVSDENAVRVEPVNWTPKTSKCIDLYMKNGWNVKQIQLRSEKGKTFNIVTKITIL